MALSGFDLPMPICQQLKKKLPKALKSLLKKHEHRDSPLTQFMVAAFYLAFRWFPLEGDDRYWVPLIAAFWEGWQDHFLDVYIAIINESLDGNNEAVEVDE